MTLFKVVKKVIIFLGLGYGLYVSSMIIYAGFTEYKPKNEIKVQITAKSTLLNAIPDSTTLSFMLWNVGYGGLGKESDFFYDKGRVLHSGKMMVRSEAEHVTKNIDGIKSFLQSAQADFFFLQEVDIKARRSFYKNLADTIQNVRTNYSFSFADNFLVKWLPIPIFEPTNPIGDVHSGIATLSKYKTFDAIRYKLPGEYGWFKRVFQLDRCMLVQRVPVFNKKELVIINAHLSAYDKGGKLKQRQLEFIKTFALNEYEKGNYVVIGADWNQCPPYFRYDAFRPLARPADDPSLNIAEDALPPDWIWAYDPTVPTNRLLETPFDEHTTFLTLIDFYLVSPNVKVKKVKGWDLGFEFSDHQPIYMEISLL